MSIRSFIGVALVAVFAAGCASAVSPEFNNGDAARRTDAVVSADALLGRDVITACRLPNGNACGLGQSCPAGDGCNQCSCSPDGILACTERDCVAICRTTADCPAGLECDGPAGCNVQWHCIGGRGCLTVESTWCDCTGNTFTTPSGCATHAYAHAGPCEMPPPPPSDAGSCGALGSGCRLGTECCSGLCMERGAINGTCAAPPAGTIGCGNTVCNATTEYCEIQYSDVPTPDSIRCLPLNDACHGRVSCACQPDMICGGCREDRVGTLVRRCPGG